MTQTTPHHLVQFAARYAVSELKTFDAFAALFRAGDLISDAQRLLELKENVKGTDVEFGVYRRTYEIFSYFAVGFVTCLQWHARSRLVDLLSYLPSCIDKKDFDQIKSDALSQMMAHNVTVAHLIGANKSVSKINQYIEVFDRVFKALSINAHIERELRDIKLSVDLAPHTNLYAVIDDLFEIRNRLVHEISLDLVGPYTIRDPWSPEIAIEYGNAVTRVIKLIEGYITIHSPKDFPNRLTPDGYPEDELEKLTQAISTLEAEISTIVSKLYDDDIEWRKASKASQLSRLKELKFIDSADFLSPLRHLDLKHVKISFLKGRFAYLLFIRKELEGWIQDDVAETKPPQSGTFATPWIVDCLK